MPLFLVYPDVFIRDRCHSPPVDVLLADAIAVLHHAGKLLLVSVHHAHVLVSVVLEPGDVTDEGLSLSHAGRPCCR